MALMVSSGPLSSLVSLSMVVNFSTMDAVVCSGVCSMYPGSGSIRTWRSQMAALASAAVAGAERWSGAVGSVWEHRASLYDFALGWPVRVLDIPVGGGF